MVTQKRQPVANWRLRRHARNAELDKSCHFSWCGCLGQRLSGSVYCRLAAPLWAEVRYVSEEVSPRFDYSQRR
jgi:hypothetical protein